MHLPNWGLRIVWRFCRYVALYAILVRLSNYSITASKIRDVYAFIAHNYADGDEILLFGFSRGAYVPVSFVNLGPLCLLLLGTRRVRSRDSSYVLTCQQFFYR